MIPEGPNKVFVGGLPIGLNEAQVRELLSEFGELRAFHLVMDHSANVSKVWMIMHCWKGWSRGTPRASRVDVCSSIDPM